jgi:hypothetical protein
VYYYQMSQQKSPKDMIQRKNTSSPQKAVAVGEMIRMEEDYCAYGVWV